MIRDFARALVFLIAFVFIVAEVQELDEMNEALIWHPN